MTDAQLAATVARAVHLMEREVALREMARRLELEPTRQEAARRLYLRASGLRKMRLALLDRCGLTR